MQFTFAAINDEDSSDDDFHFDAPTKEAQVWHAFSVVESFDSSEDYSSLQLFLNSVQEFHLTEMYEDALTRLHAGELESARDLLQSILQNPLLLRAQVTMWTNFGTVHGENVWCWHPDMGLVFFSG